jgi:hypothetical protein
MKAKCDERPGGVLDGKHGKWQKNMLLTVFLK